MKNFQKVTQCAPCKGLAEYFLFQLPEYSNSDWWQPLVLPCRWDIVKTLPAVTSLCHPHHRRKLLKPHTCAVHDLRYWIIAEPRATTSGKRERVQRGLNQSKSSLQWWWGQVVTVGSVLAMSQQQCRMRDAISGSFLGRLLKAHR